MNIFHKKLFENTVTIVTGGGTGIGRAITSDLVKLGGHVVIASRKTDVLENTKSDLSPNRIHVKQCDVTKSSDVKELFEFTKTHFGRLDHLVNNAGGQFPSPAENISANGFSAVMKLNVDSIFETSKHALNIFKEKERVGTIVNIIADMHNGFPGMAHTGAARSAVENLTKSLSMEWIRHGVRVNAVAPGLIYSETAAKNYPPGFLESFANEIPAKRLGTPEEVSSAVCFLLSPGASYITGVTLRVDAASSLYRRVGFEIPDINDNDNDQIHPYI